VTAAEETGLARASALVATGTLLSRLTGLVRVVVLAYAVGRLTLADAYNLANTTPNVVYELLLGGVLTATLVPLFVDHARRGDDRATAAVCTAAMAALVALSLVAVAAAPWIARLYAIGAEGAARDAQLEVTTFLIRCFMPQICFYGLTALATALLHAHRRFAAAAYAPVLNNLVVVGALLAFTRAAEGSQDGWVDVARIRGDTGLLLLLGLGTTAGIAATGLALVPAVRAAGMRLRPVLDWRHTAVRRVVRMSGWTAGYVVANQLALLFVLLLAKSGDPGDVSAYQYAFIFFQLPHGLFAVSIMTTVTPELARAASAGDLDALRRDLARGLRYLLLVVVPAAAALGVLAQPAVAVLVRGGFDAADARVTADVVQALAVGLVPFSVYLYLLRGFYATTDTRTPFLVNAVENAANVALALALFPALGVPGLGLAYAGAYVVAAVLALAALRRRIGGVPGERFGATLAGAGAGAVALAAVAAPLAGAIGSGTPARALGAVAAGGAAGALAYAAVLGALKVPEIVTITRVRPQRAARPDV
jgi:putative peptidoglycan lipid II flippase